MQTNSLIGSSLFRLSAGQLWVAGISLTILQYLTMGYLNQLYAATEFPVSYFVGQTAFDGNLIKSYYSVLIEKGKLDDYHFVQVFDYLFMITVFFSHLFVCAAIYKTLPSIKMLQRVGYTMIVVTPLAAIMDAFENLVSFFMLADPVNFANWLAYPYSIFAVVKFFLFTLFMIWVAFSVVTIVAYGVYSKLSRSNAIE